jgi:hypothetical protein
MRRPGVSRSRKRLAGIREIAQALGVSIGTVDRALHDRRGIKVEGVRPPTVIRLSPHIVMKSNLKLFLERMRPDKAKGQGAVGRPARAGRGGSVASYADEIT